MDFRNIIAFDNDTPILAFLGYREPPETAGLLSIQLCGLFVAQPDSHLGGGPANHGGLSLVRRRLELHASIILQLLYASPDDPEREHSDE